MEENQLDFNAPFLSVRHLSSKLDSSDGINKMVSRKRRPNRHNSLPLDKSDFELGEVTKPAAVPFQWEHIPGKAKDGSKSYPRPPEEPSNTPRLPPGRLLSIIKQISDKDFDDRKGFSPKIEDRKRFSTQIEASPLTENATLMEDDDEYSDVLDTLSQADSFSWNCSVSCLSGYDSEDVKPVRNFSRDPQTLDFMMSRFIPAAKAMVLETPQYVSRKHPVVPERPREVKKVVGGELRPLLERYGTNPVSHYSHYKGDVESEDGDDDDEYDDLGKKTDKACGFLPRLTVKNSFCPLNPVPGMKLRAHTPISPSAVEVRRMTRSAYSGPLPQTSLEKHSWDALYRKKSQLGPQSQALHENENKLTHKPNQFYHSGELYTTAESYLYRRSQGCRISPYRNESPRSPFHNGARFLGIPKEVENVEANKFSPINKVSDNILDVSSDQTYKWSGTVSPVVEKTLYIDSVNNIKIRTLNSASSEAEGTLVKRVEESSTVKRKAFGSVDAHIPSSVSISNLSEQADRIESMKLDEDIEQKFGSLECSKMDPNGNLDMKYEDTIKGGDQGNLSIVPFQSPLPPPPPLPKSPSESWLWRTLPSISLRNPFSQLNSRKQGRKNSTTGSKWETIVKTSNVHHDHARYSKEIIPHLSQHSKT